MLIQFVTGRTGERVGGGVDGRRELQVQAELVQAELDRLVGS